MAGNPLSPESAKLIEAFEATVIKVGFVADLTECSECLGEFPLSMFVSGPEGTVLCPDCAPKYAGNSEYCSDCGCLMEPDGLVAQSSTEGICIECEDDYTPDAAAAPTERDGVSR